MTTPCARMLLAALVVAAAPASAQPADVVRFDPYAAQGIAHDLGRDLSLSDLQNEADTRARTASTGIENATVAELYKRLGNAQARTYYERAIAAEPMEPAWELFYAEYLRLSRGAGQQPLFAQAERHLFAAFKKLDLLAHDPAAGRDWDQVTLDRSLRARATLYERDGFQLISVGDVTAGSSVPTRVPKLFFSPTGRLARAFADLDQSSDVRLLTSAALFSEHLGVRSLTLSEQRELTHVVTPSEAGGRLRVRSGAAPVVDLSWQGRETARLQVTDFRRPTVFNDFRMTRAGVGLEQPFSIGGTADAIVKGRFDRVTRRGLIEGRPAADERLNQITVSSALSWYAGPDRVNLSYVYIGQQIDPDPADLAARDRRFNGATASYQIFRALPLPGHDLNAAGGRRFETRGIDLLAGVLRDRERFPATSGDVFIDRLDRFIGVSAKGLGRMDLTFQPTWYSSRVTNDPSQANGQLRFAGNALVRLLDQERTAGIPDQRWFGLPVASLQVVVPFHWDRALNGPATFVSRRVGLELWTKLITAKGTGVAVLASGGFGYQRFPALGKDEWLFNLQVGVGF